MIKAFVSCIYPKKDMPSKRVGHILFAFCYDSSHALSPALCIPLGEQLRCAVIKCIGSLVRQLDQHALIGALQR